MSDKHLLDEWLAFLFRQPVKTQNIASLQQDVWRKIRIAESEERPSNGFESLLYWLFAPRHQFATVAAVVFMSVALGFTAPETATASASSLSAKALGLEVYSSSYAHPFSLAQLGSP